MSGWNLARLSWLVSSKGRPVGVKEEDGDETMIPVFSADLQSLLKPDGSVLAGQGVGYVLPAATANALGGVKAGAGVSIAGDGTLSTAGGSGGAAVYDIAFSQSIPLSTRGESLMPLQRIATTGPLNLSPAAGAVRGAYCLVTVVGDGSTALTVTGAAEDSGSVGFTNVANMPYDFVFWYTGYECRYTIQQALNPVAILGAPTAPSQMAAPVAGAGINSASITLTAPSNNGGSAITGYTVVSNPAGGVDAAAGTTALNRTITGLAAGTAYTFTATATNGVGPSPASPASNSVTPTNAATAPGAPTIGAAVAGDGYVDVAFAAPASNGGAAIIDYTATLSTGQTATGAASPIRVTAPNGTAVTATVKARNSVNAGPASAASNSVTPAAAQASTYSHLTALDHMVESGSGPFNYVVASSAGTFNTQGGVTAVKRPPGSTSSAAIVNTSGNQLILGTTNSTSAVGFASMPQAIWTQALGQNYTPFTLGTQGVPTTAMASQANDDIQLRWSAGNLIAEVARSASPTVFTTVYTWVGVDIATAVAVNIATNGNFSGVQTVGFA